MDNTTQPKKVSFWGSIKNDIIDLLKFLAIAAIIVIPIRHFVMQPFIVSGTSMDPTFADKEYLIIDKLTYNLNKINRGDVVVFKFPSRNERYLVKRIIGLPGDTVTLKSNGDITIINEQNPNGFTVQEEYVVNKDQDSFTITVPKDSNKILVLGDNRKVSYDSRAWGLLEKDRLVGRVYLRLWPVGRIDVLPGKTDVLNK